jgi:hypothetical protein
MMQDNIVAYLATLGGLFLIGPGNPLTMLSGNLAMPSLDPLFYLVLSAGYVVWAAMDQRLRTTMVRAHQTN